ncbi:MAG TPA: nucleotidyltransferase domain-containing protein [Chitinophagaceae bacterium]|jgi:predicted nucleotidyltransferase
MLNQAQIDRLIEEIVSGYQPEKIYLFGSYASGKPTNDSDIDLFIIKNTNKRRIERSREVRRCIKSYPLTGVDIIVYTPLELSDGLQQTINIGKEAITTGVLLYERL